MRATSLLTGSPRSLHSLAMTRNAPTHTKQIFLFRVKPVANATPYHKSLSICWGMALSGMLHQNDSPNTNIFSSIVFGIFTRSFSYRAHSRELIPIFLDINSVPTPNILRAFFNSCPAVINASNSSRKIARLNFCCLLSGIIFPPLFYYQ